MELESLPIAERAPVLQRVVTDWLLDYLGREGSRGLRERLRDALAVDHCLGRFAAPPRGEARDSTLRVALLQHFGDLGPIPTSRLEPIAMLLAFGLYWVDWEQVAAALTAPGPEDT